MDKRYPVSNGFTLIEMLLVLLIVSVVSFGIYVKPQSSLYLFMKQLQSYCILSQQKAFIFKETQNIYSESNSIYFNEGYIEIPSSISCTPFSFHYNEKGNISKAHSITCHNENKAMKLIFQLGSGRVRLEK